MTLQKLKNLEKEVIVFALDHGFSAFIPLVGPWQFYGIEINPYAYELAQMTLWIGYLQWVRANGWGTRDDPILRPMDTFVCEDAIIDMTSPEVPKHTEWPAAEFIVGNPPFLGGKKMREALGDAYVDGLRRSYKGKLPPFSDLCCYWFEKARESIERGRTKRVGLLAMQSIRGGANRAVLSRIKQTGDIFFAVSDRKWVLEGANVHVSLIGFDDGSETVRELDGRTVRSIETTLVANQDLSVAQRLTANAAVSFIGIQPSGSFEIPEAEVAGYLQSYSVLGEPCSSVLRPFWRAVDVVRRWEKFWVVDFTQMSFEKAAAFERPFELLKGRVPAQRKAKHFIGYPFWKFWRPRGELLEELRNLSRYLVTPRVAKHRVFVWLRAEDLPDCQLVAFARADDYFFGVLQSRSHEVWARVHGTQVRERESGFRYTPTTCFETFPFPKATDFQRDVISAAAKALDEMRSRWLNSPELTHEEMLEFPGMANGPWGRYVEAPDSHGVGTVRYPRLAPRDEECAKHLKKRTLTTLYNEKPTWLTTAHRRLDLAVFAAYDWDPDLPDELLLGRLLALNMAQS